MLSSQEERVWDDIQRHWAMEVEEPPRPAPSRRKRVPRGQADVPVAVAIGARVTIILLLFGAAPAALAVALATALGWALWRNRPPLSGQDALVMSPDPGKDRATADWQPQRSAVAQPNVTDRRA